MDDSHDDAAGAVDLLLHEAEERGSQLAREDGPYCWEEATRYYRRNVGELLGARWIDNQAAGFVKSTSTERLVDPRMDRLQTILTAWPPCRGPRCDGCAQPEPAA